MVKQVNIGKAKANFSKLVEEVEAGAEIVVARDGKPILKLVKLDEAQPIAPDTFDLGRMFNEENQEEAWAEYAKRPKLRDLDDLKRMVDLAKLEEASASYKANAQLANSEI